MEQFDEPFPALRESLRKRASDPEQFCPWCGEPYVEVYFTYHDEETTIFWTEGGPDGCIDACEGL